MGPVALARLVGAVTAVVVDVEEEPTYTRVTVFGVVPVFDTRWKGVQRRQARRAARREARKAAKVADAGKYLDEVAKEMKQSDG
jgi:hypothetical protein